MDTLIDQLAFRWVSWLAQAGGTTPTFTSKDALSMLLSTESLLFAALTVALGLSAMSAFGETPGVPRALSTGAAVALSAAAIGASFAWIDLFLVGEWPSGGWAKASVVCILVGIVAQPVIAWVLVVLIWKRT